MNKYWQWNDSITYPLYSKLK